MFILSPLFLFLLLTPILTKKKKRSKPEIEDQETFDQIPELDPEVNPLRNTEEVGKINEERGVIIMNDKNFDQIVKNHSYIMVFFYADWCSHCKDVMPIYEKVAQTLRKENIFLGKVDGTKEKMLAEKFDLTGFPTFKLMVNGNANEYVGGRTEEAFLNYLRRKSGPRLKELNSKDEINKYKEEYDVVLVYFGDDEEKKKIFTNASDNNVDLGFGIAKKNELANEFQAKKDSVILFKKFDEKMDKLENMTVETIEKFIIAYSTPKVMKFDDKAADLIFVKKNPALFLFADAKDGKSQQYDEIMHKLAEKFTDKLKFSIINPANEGLEENLAQYLGVRKTELPAVRLADARIEHVKYAFSGDISDTNLETFINDWQNNKLKRFYKSADEPKENSGDVYILTANAFDKEITKSNRDVMLLFYAPWCSHCQKFMPEYEKAAKLLKKNTNLLMAKIDTTENDVESVELEGLPTVKFYPGNKTNITGIDYYGDRTTPDIIQFIKKKAYNKIVTEEDLKDKKNGEL